MVVKNDITGDLLQSRPSTKAYEDEWDKVFGKSPIKQRVEELERVHGVLADRIHYPQCWDTAAYPTLGDALLEVTASCGCSECNTGIAADQKGGE